MVEEDRQGRACLGKDVPMGGVSHVGVRAEVCSHTGVVKRQKADKLFYLTVVGYSLGVARERR